MNADVLKGKWQQLKGEVKSQWGQLTDDDLNRIGGDAEKLVGRVQERYGYERDRAKREVDNFITRHPDVR
ncbi:MAG: CsbD family protein [Acidobacteria bacterium]|nr:MAG: CsbD family protein [Acidobacteriota bacterium]